MSYEYEFRVTAQVEMPDDYQPTTAEDRRIQQAIMDALETANPTEADGREIEDWTVETA